MQFVYIKRRFLGKPQDMILDTQEDDYCHWV